jgi:uncharacterized membrane protein YeaQ/YmgE (transglycosylase-associated protein family)
MLCSFIAYLIFGGIVGWLASILVGRNKQMGAVANILIGIAGSLVAGFIISLLFPGAPEVAGLNLYSIVTSVLGAGLLLLITGWFRK